MLAAVVLALLNRKLSANNNTNKVEDDSMELSLCLFLNAIILSVLTVADYALPYYPDVLDILYDICLVVGATSFLLFIIFVPGVRLCKEVSMFILC